MLHFFPKHFSKYISVLSQGIVVSRRSSGVQVCALRLLAPWALWSSRDEAGAHLISSRNACNDHNSKKYNNYYRPFFSKESFKVHVKDSWVGYSLLLKGKLKYLVISKGTQFCKMPHFTGQDLVIQLSWDFIAVYLKRVDIPTERIDGKKRMSDSGDCGVLILTLKTKCPHQKIGHKYSNSIHLTVEICSYKYKPVFLSCTALESCLHSFSDAELLGSKLSLTAVKELR